MEARDWKTILIVLLVVAVGVLLAGGGFRSRAYGQSEGRTSGVICVVGQAVNQFAPIVLVDVPDQTIMVYEYSYQNDDIELTAVRTYRYDKLLKEFHPEGASVEEVRRHVMQQQQQ
ncbi:MAG: hypothetical protein ACYS8K_01305 [Planctomycetota bacterium]|jgi:hypothetical protein